MSQFGPLQIKDPFPHGTMSQNLEFSCIGDCILSRHLAQNGFGINGEWTNLHLPLNSCSKIFVQVLRTLILVPCLPLSSSMLLNLQRPSNLLEQSIYRRYLPGSLLSYASIAMVMLCYNALQYNGAFCKMHCMLRQIVRIPL